MLIYFGGLIWLGAAGVLLVLAGMFLRAGFFGYNFNLSKLIL